MNATAERVSNSTVAQARDAIKSSWSQSERERRRRLANIKQTLLAALLLRNCEAVRTRAA